MMNKYYYVERIFAFIAALILFQTLYFKFSGHPDSILLFTQLGVEPFGRIALGFVELIVGCLLVFRRTSHLGAIAGILIMMGALASHIFIIGINFNHDNGLLFGLACTTLICCGTVLFVRRKQGI